MKGKKSCRHEGSKMSQSFLIHQKGRSWRVTKDTFEKNKPVKLTESKSQMTWMSSEIEVQRPGERVCFLLKMGSRVEKGRKLDHQLRDEKDPMTSTAHSLPGLCVLSLPPLESQPFIPKGDKKQPPQFYGENFISRILRSVTPLSKRNCDSRHGTQ